MWCIPTEKFGEILGHKFHLLVAVLSTAFGSGFLSYNTYVTNNIQIVGEHWVNHSYYVMNGIFPDGYTLKLYWANVVAAKEFGKIAGTLILPFVAENLGRKSALLGNALITITGSCFFLMARDSSYPVIIVGRILSGITNICGAGLASLFLIEIAPTDFHGLSGAFFQIFRGFGGLLAQILTLEAILGTPQLWTAALAIPAIPAIFQLIGLLFCMESPRHLFITEDKIPEAMKSIIFYQGKENAPFVLEDLETEKRHIEHQQHIPMQQLVKSGDFWRPFLLASLALSNYSLAGILIIQTYSTDLLINAGFDNTFASYCTVMLGLCDMVSALFVVFTVELFGRKFMLLYSNLGCLVCLILIALCSYHTTGSKHWLSYSILGFLILFMLIFPILASVCNVVASEICHQYVRAYTFTVGYLCCSTVSLLSSYIYPLLKEQHGVGFFF